MLEELLKPQVFRRDPDGMGETRLRASALLCKIFLQYLTQLSARQGMETLTDLWLKILGYQDRFMHSGRRDQMVSIVKFHSCLYVYRLLISHFPQIVRSCTRIAQECTFSHERIRILNSTLRSTNRSTDCIMGCYFR